MGTSHGGPVELKPIGEVAEFKRKLIPAHIPDSYALKPSIKAIADENIIREGVAAYRDFLYLLFDRLASDGQAYARPPKSPKGMADYPFINYVSNFLVEIGYYGKLGDDGGSLLVSDIPSFSPSAGGNGKTTGPKIPASGQIDCLRFLSICGFSFTGVDLNAKALKYAKGQILEVLFPSNPILLTGLKALSVADVEIRKHRRYWNDNHILRCDYRLLMAEEAGTLGVLKDFLNPLPIEVQDFAIKLHQRYTGMGLECVILSDDQLHFAYSYISNSKRVFTPRDIYTVRVFEFSLSLRHGYCIFVRAKKIGKYSIEIEKYAQPLKDIIIHGYGCDRKLRGERCQHGCQGARIPMDGSMLEMGGDIVDWLDCEVSSIIKKQVI